MKMGSLLKKSLIALLPISLGLGVLLGVNKNSVQRVEGYSTSSLPTTIDLNDTSASAIRSYYSSLNSLGTSERQGTNLLKNLKTILKNGQKYYSYDSGSAIWQIYEIADRDWAKSPASSTTYGTYNSSTNKITGYTYGTSKSSSKNNPYIHALYINRDVTNQTTAWDDHDQDEWGINREHVWPKAEGFETSGAGGARGDPMHLMAGNGYANNIHSNYYYGYVKTSTTYTDCGTKYSNQSGNLRGTSKTLNTGTVFEPQDCDKGDIARAVFYMVARYNYYSGSDSDGIDSNNPNLELTQSLSDWASSGYSSTTSKKGKMGILTDLLNWHHQDPVDQYEIHRNNLLFTNYTNNRNPFIDFPEWVDYIWGTATYNGTTYSSYSSTPTGYATPSSDTINGYNSGSSDPIAVTGVTLNKSSASIEVGASEVLTATVSPNNATNQSVSWESSDPGVATVSSSGRVTGIAEGSATITATTDDGSFTASCTVSVSASSSSPGETAEWHLVTSNQTDWSGEYILANGSSGSVKVMDVASFDADPNFGYLSDTYTVSNNNLTVDESNKITICKSATTNGKYSIIANGYYIGRDANSNGVDSLATSLSYTSNYDNSISYANGKVTIAGNGGRTLTWYSNNSNFRYYSSSNNCTQLFKKIELSSIVVKTAPSKISYTAGDDFIPAGLVITLTYSDSSTEDIPYEDNEDYFEFTPQENLQTSDTIVTISYGGKSCNQAITVTEPGKTLSSISVDTAPTKISYTEGEYFDPLGLVIRRTYSDATSDTYSYAGHTSEFSFTPSTLTELTTSNTSVTIEYGGFSCSQAITVSKEVVPEGQTKVSLNIGEYADANSWANGTRYTSITMDENISITVSNGGSNTGKYYTNGEEWRLYQTEDAEVTISCVEGYTILSVEITYAVSNTGVMIVDDEEVASGASNSVNSDTFVFSVGNTGSATNGQVKVTNVVVVYEAYSEPSTYSLVTDVTDLRTGDNLIFVGLKNGLYYGATELSNGHLGQETISVSNNIATISDSLEFTIIRDGNYISFEYNNQYLCGSDANNIKTTFVDSITNDAKFSVSLSSNKATIIGQGNINNKYFRFYNNTNNIYFTFHYNNTSYYDVYLFKKTSQVLADVWCQDFLDNTSNGVDTCFTTNWDDLASDYNNLAANVKREIYEAEANASTDYNLRSQAMARYEYMISDPRFDVSNFISERGVSQSKPNISILLGKPTDNVIIIVTYSLIGVSAIGGYFFMKSKRKEEF